MRLLDVFLSFLREGVARCSHLEIWSLFHRVPCIWQSVAPGVHVTVNGSIWRNNPTHFLVEVVLAPFTHCNLVIISTCPLYPAVTSCLFRPRSTRKLDSGRRPHELFPSSVQMLFRQWIYASVSFRRLRETCSTRQWLVAHAAVSGDEFHTFPSEGGQPFAAIFSPVVDYCVGGSDFDDKAAVLGTDSLPVLTSGWEATHSGCVVFGRHSFNDGIMRVSAVWCGASVFTAACDHICAVDSCRAHGESLGVGFFALRCRAVGSCPQGHGSQKLAALTGVP